MNKKDVQRRLEVTLDETLYYDMPFDHFAYLIQEYIQQYGADSFLDNIRKKYVESNLRNGQKNYR